MRLCAYLFIAVLSWGTLTATAHAELGASLSEVQKRDFFTFFNLTETSRSSQGDQTVALFQPKAGDFRKLVRVQVTLDSEEHISAIELELARSFVDHHFNSIFARDIGKSLLRQFLSEQDKEALGSLIVEIEHGQNANAKFTTHKVNGAPDPVLPEAPSAPYQVWLGGETPFAQDLKDARVEFSNSSEGTLVIRLTQNK